MNSDNNKDNSLDLKDRLRPRKKKETVEELQAASCRNTKTARTPLKKPLRTSKSTETLNSKSLLDEASNSTSLFERFKNKFSPKRPQESTEPLLNKTYEWPNIENNSSENNNIENNNTERDILREENDYTFSDPNRVEDLQNNLDNLAANTGTIPKKLGEKSNKARRSLQLENKKVQFESNILQPISDLDNTNFFDFLGNSSLANSLVAPQNTLVEGLNNLNLSTDDNLSEEEEVEVIMELSDNAKFFLKGLPVLGRDPSALEIKTWVDKMRFAENKLPVAEHRVFRDKVEYGIDATIRNTYEGKVFNHLVDFIDFIEKQYGVSKSLPRALEELIHMRKLSRESYTSYGRRLLNETKELMRQVQLNSPENEWVGRMNQIEEVVLKAFIQNIRDGYLCARLGVVENLIDAVEKIIELEKDLYGDDLDRPRDREIERVERPEIKITFGTVTKRCQGCNRLNHEFLNCPDFDCYYCGNWDHKTNNCDVAPSEVKFRDICKMCNKKGHTMSCCDSLAREEGKIYCQLCQKSDHNAKNCEVDIMKFCFKCKGLEHRNGEVCPKSMELVRANNNVNNNTGNNGNINKFKGQCFICNEQGHIAKFCPLKNSNNNNNNSNNNNGNFNRFNYNNQNGNLNNQNRNFNNQNGNFNNQNRNFNNQNRNFNNQNRNFNNQGRNFNNQNNGNFQGNFNNRNRGGFRSNYGNDNLMDMLSDLLRSNFQQNGSGFNGGNNFNNNNQGGFYPNNGNFNQNNGNFNQNNGNFNQNTGHFNQNNGSFNPNNAGNFMQNNRGNFNRNVQHNALELGGQGN